MVGANLFLGRLRPEISAQRGFFLETVAHSGWRHVVHSSVPDVRVKSAPQRRLSLAVGKPTGNEFAQIFNCRVRQGLRFPGPVPGVRSEPAISEISKGDVEMARKGKTTFARGDGGKICRGAGISEQTYYKWRRKYRRA
jgi:hypothetical protein